MFNVFGAPAHDVAADEEVSRRKGDSTVLSHIAPTPAPVTETTSTASAAGVVPLAPLTPPLPSPAEPTATSPVVIMPPAPLTSLPSLPPQGPPHTPQQTAPSPDGEDGRQSPPHQTTLPVSPLARSPGCETTELPNVLDQPTSEQDPSPDLLPGPPSDFLPSNLPPDLLPDASNQFARSLSPAGAFVYSGSLPFIPPAIKYFETVRAGQRWTDMVASFLRLEEFPPTRGVHISFLPLILFAN
jgi:hypothetical protein